MRVVTVAAALFSVIATSGVFGGFEIAGLSCRQPSGNIGGSLNGRTLYKGEACPLSVHNLSQDEPKGGLSMRILSIGIIDASLDSEKDRSVSLVNTYRSRANLVGSFTARKDGRAADFVLISEPSRAFTQFSLGRVLFHPSGVSQVRSDEGRNSDISRGRMARILEDVGEFDDSDFSCHSSK